MVSVTPTPCVCQFAGKSELADLKVLVEVMRQILLNSARTNGSLAGIMFWSAAHNDSDDQDG